jgi:ATP-dependent helicase/nuclease subunit B
MARRGNDADGCIRSLRPFVARARLLNAYGNTLPAGRPQIGDSISVTLETGTAPLDGRWWDATAGHLLEFAARCSLPGRDLRALTVLVSRIADAPCLRAALHRALGASSALVAPRITTLERWVGAAAMPQTQRLVELFEALRAAAWVREAFGDRPAALWALSAELVRLGDELTLAAVGADRAFEGRWRDSVARHFQRRAAVAASIQSQLVLQLWRAHAGSQSGAAALLKRWSARARRSEGPLALLAPFGLPAWQRALLQQHADRQPVCVVEGDLAAADPGWLAPTWPELVDPDRAPGPIAGRAEAAAAQAPPRLRIVAARSLEEEASAAASEVDGWLRSGLERIALVALDRLTARRLRALLERAGILAADEAGWKLSTTSAAAAVMRWLDLVSGDFRLRDLLDWLRSPFVLAGRGGRLAAARLIDRVARSGALAGGLRAVGRAIDGLDDGQPEAEEARAILALLAQQAGRMQAADTLDRLGRALSASLDALAMRPALAQDAVGADVLRELDRLRESMAGSPVRMSLAAFRELLATHFESTNATGPGADSPVRMTSLAGACLRGFEAALLIGADAEHLPSATEPGVLISGGVRRDLGLATAADLHRTQAIELATLLCSVPQVCATWRVREGDEPRALSPWLDRLRVMAARAGWPDPVVDFELPRRTVAARVPLQPAPDARGLLPERLSVGACQSLVDCPYQFYARYMLGLRRRAFASDLPDKRDLGTLLHSILYRLHREQDPGGIERASDAELRHALERITQEEFGRELRERPALIAYRRRVLDLIPGYVDWLRRRAQAGWRLQSVETAFQVPLPVDASLALELSGRIDRIDVRGSAEREVIDYKARSHRAVRKAAADPGEDVQLPLYALALGPDATGASYLSFERAPEPDRAGAGAVRQFAAAPPLDRWARRVGERLCGDLARIAGGAGLAALGTGSTCSRCEVRGLCRRAEWAPE